MLSIGLHLQFLTYKNKTLGMPFLSPLKEVLSIILYLAKKVTIHHFKLLKSPPTEKYF